MALGGRTQRCPRRLHAEVPLVTGRAARELLRARVAHVVTGQHQVAREGLETVDLLTIVEFIYRHTAVRNKWLVGGVSADYNCGKS